VRELGDLLVRDLARLLRRVDRKDDEHHLQLAVHLRHLRHRRVLRLVAEVASHRFLLLVRRIVYCERRLPGMRVDVDRHDFFKLHARITLAESEYSSSTSAARRPSTARWLMEPLSVISPASSDGGSSSTSMRRMRFELPVLCAAKVFSRCASSSRDALLANT